MSYGLFMVCGFLIRNPVFITVGGGREHALFHIERRLVVIGGEGRKSKPVRDRIVVEAPELVRKTVRPYCRDGTWVQIHGSLEYEDRECKCGELIRTAQIVIRPGAAGGELRLLRRPPEAERAEDGPRLADSAPIGAQAGQGPQTRTRKGPEA